ncbi:hypothetical protein [uncultured Nostoc sp.]|uniref:hypothetical protein n=1 Tax=uncultured Nostoc sp. TaxID=340711 RepID=UPI0035C9D1D2
MNFFEHQDRARQNTQQLIGLFSLSIAVMIMAIYIATLFLFQMAPRIWWHPGLFLYVAGITIIAIALASLYKIAYLREGKSVIAEELGGRLLIPEMADEQGRQLLNIVEEMAIALALALDTENMEIQERQIAWLREVQPAELVDKTLELSSEISQLDPRIRLPLVDLAVPVLRQNSAKECQRLCKCIHGLVVATGSLSLWHFVLQLILWHRLQPSINPTSATTVEFTSIEEIWPDSLLVLSVIARVGYSQPDASTEDIAYAFRCGVFRLPKAGEQEKPEIPLTYNFTELKKSIDRLRLASPKLKQAIVDACAHTVLLDNKVTQSEADLLRAIAMTLDCPIPPFLNPQRGVSKQKQSSPQRS